MSENSDDRNVMLYFLAGVGVGALIGAAAGVLLAPKPGHETREDIAHWFDEMKTKVKSKMKKGVDQVGSALDSADEAGA